MGAVQIPVVSGSTFYCSLLQSLTDFLKVSAFRLKFFLFNLSMIFTDIVIIFVTFYSLLCKMVYARYLASFESSQDKRRGRMCFIELKNVCLLIFLNSFSTSSNYIKKLILQVHIFEESSQKTKNKNQKINNIKSYCVIWKILSDPVIKEYNNEHKQRQDNVKVFCFTEQTQYLAQLFRKHHYT